MIYVFADVAQLVERRVAIAKAESSSLFICSMMAGMQIVLSSWSDIPVSARACGFKSHPANHL